MSIWDVASAAIARAFADPEPLVYHQGGQALSITAIRQDGWVPDPVNFNGRLPETSYELHTGLLPAAPTKVDWFTHRGRRWRIQATEPLPASGAVRLIVSDDGAAS